MAFNIDKPHCNYYIVGNAAVQQNGVIMPRVIQHESTTPHTRESSFISLLNWEGSAYVTHCTGCKRSPEVGPDRN
jgi:hypothetical protein